MKEKIRSLSLTVRLAISTVITLAIVVIIIFPLQNRLETKIAKEYYGKVYLDLEKAKRHVLKGESVESINGGSSESLDKFGAVTLLEWSDKTIAQSWLDSTNATEEDRALLALGKLAIEQTLPNILQPQVLPDIKRTQLGVLKEAVKLLPTEITRQKSKDWTLRLALWGAIVFLACVWGFVMKLLLVSEPDSESTSTKKTNPLFVFIPLFCAILVIWRLNHVIWTNALLISLS